MRMRVHTLAHKDARAWFESHIYILYTWCCYYYHNRNRRERVFL